MRRSTPETLAKAIRQARGLLPSDLIVQGARVLDVATLDLIDGDVAIADGRIVGVGRGREAAATFDASGLIAVPGFIDAHCHVESSLLTPFEFERCVLPHGVTGAVWDPHEIANVLGLEGVRYALAAAERAAIGLFVQLSSCVPATAFETSGAALESRDLEAFKGHPNVLGLAEVMNFPGVLSGDAEVLAKLASFADRRIDGHAPLLRGRDLDAYVAAGIRTEHEATTYDEAREKLQKGLTVLIREGSVSKDLDALCPLVTPETSAFLAFCTDDRNPLDIAEEGHLDHMIRRAIALGAPSRHVYRVASWSAANAYGLRDRGMIAPGRRADIVLVSDLDACAIEAVIVGGRLVGPDLFADRGPLPEVGRKSVARGPVEAGDFALPDAGEASVIGVEPGRIITRHLKRRLPDPAVNAVAVVERHGVNGNIGLGRVEGFKLKRGAIASSVGHDSHNVTVVGADPAAMAAAVNRVVALEGGFVVAAGETIQAEFALPIAGLMSGLPFEAVRAALGPLRAAARSLGCPLPEPFLQVAFLPLPVIPHLKITDKGLFDVDRFVFV